jgi:nucleoside-diphosphate-sugar epimerase
MTQILVTGSSGFIGNHLIERLQAIDTTVVGLDRIPGLICRDQIHRDLLDIRHDLKLREQLGTFTHVVHLAAESYVPTSVTDPHRYVENNVVGTMNLIEALASSHNLTRFILVSSCEVYGSTPEPVDETSPTRPASPYAASKLSQEAFCQAAAECYGLPLVTVRLFNNYGPGQQPDRLIPALIRAAATGRIFEMAADGVQTRDWVDVRDVVDALIRLLNADGVHGMTFNVSAENELSVRDVCAMVFRYATTSPRFVHVPPVEGYLVRSVGQSELLRQTIGWRPARSLDHFLQQAVKEAITC